MNTLEITIKEIKNIKFGKIEIPLEKGIYAFVGINGCGKSTLLQALAQIISRHHLGGLNKADYNENSSVTFQKDDIIDVWTKKNQFWGADTYPNTMKLNGNYEGSLFYGARFNDSKIVDFLVEGGQFHENEIIEADTYIKEKMSYIIHGDYTHYRHLKKVRNKFISKKFNLKNTPYFYEVNNELISQYRMSSGECLLLSLLHFVYNSLVRKSLPINETILLLIDEIEVALHPTAIGRLLDLLNDLTIDSKNLVVILTTHAPEVIRSIAPQNIYKIENNNGEINVVNPCYPSYAIREVYTHDGYDYLLLVEDELTKSIVDKVLSKFQLGESRLVHICPVGGWENVLTLQRELLNNNVLGTGKKVISILDGDVVEEANKNYQSQKKIFLPIESIEKFIYKIFIDVPNPRLKKIINDKYFTLKSVDTLISEFMKLYPITPKQANKKLYFKLRKDLETRGITEKEFITKLTEDILNVIDFSNFAVSLKGVLE